MAGQQKNPRGASLNSGRRSSRIAQAATNGASTGSTTKFKSEVFLRKQLPTQGSIPLLDFALGLTGLLTRLPRSNNEVLEFTESSAELRFELIHDEVEVRSNFAASIGRTPLYALREAVRRLGDEVLHMARQEAPGIDANPDIRRLASALSNP